MGHGDDITIPMMYGFKASGATYGANSNTDLILRAYFKDQAIREKRKAEEKRTRWHFIRRWFDSWRGVHRA
jgi:hypothetical protein